MIVRTTPRTCEEWSLGDLETLRLVLRGGSVIDWRRVHFATKEEVDRYLRLCLFEPEDPFDRARLQDVLDQAVQYLRMTFRYRVAEEVAHPRQIEDLFLWASGVKEPKGLRRIACIALKLMHVVHHVQARALLHRARIAEDELAHLATARVDQAVAELRREGMPIVAAAGSVKTKHSILTKLLAKKENLAAQVYDRVRYRIVAASRDDVLPLLLRLCDVLLPFAFVVPGQTQNTLFDFKKLVQGRAELRKLSSELQAGLDLEAQDRRSGHAPRRNEFSGEGYRALNFVVDLPVRLPERAVDPGDPLVTFCMLELQLVDQETALANERGRNSHARYKKRQLRTVLARLSRGLVVPKRTQSRKETP
ncbi:MAG: TIGR04552 family protein [Myxococcales bacterium]